jgi:hypothetical protein
MLLKRARGGEQDFVTRRCDPAVGRVRDWNSVSAVHAHDKK